MHNFAQALAQTSAAARTETAALQETHFLAPVSFNEDVATMAVNPAMAHPDGMRPGRLFPAAWRPDVGIAVPLVITADPNVARTGRGNSCFDDLSGRPHPHDYFLSLNRTEANRYGKQSGR